MIDSSRAVENVVGRLEKCGFVIRKENRCFYESLIEEILKEIVENGEVFLKEKINQDGTLIVDYGEIKVFEDGSIIGTDSTNLKIQ